MSRKKWDPKAWNETRRRPASLGQRAEMLRLLEAASGADETAEAEKSHEGVPGIVIGKAEGASRAAPGLLLARRPQKATG